MLKCTSTMSWITSTYETFIITINLFLSPLLSSLFFSPPFFFPFPFPPLLFYNSGDHHLIERHKALLPAFEDENDDCSESNIDVGVYVD